MLSLKVLIMAIRPSVRWWWTMLKGTLSNGNQKHVTPFRKAHHHLFYPLWLQQVLCATAVPIVTSTAIQVTTPQSTQHPTQDTTSFATSPSQATIHPGIQSAAPITEAGFSSLSTNRYLPLLILGVLFPQRIHGIKTLLWAQTGRFNRLFVVAKRDTTSRIWHRSNQSCSFQIARIVSTEHSAISWDSCHVICSNGNTVA